MGKEQPEPNEEELIKTDEQELPKKKIIKKFPFKPIQSDTKDDLKDWKPTKIEKKTEGEAVKPKQKNEDIAASFLGSLSKPINKNAEKTKSFFDDEPIVTIPKPAVNLKKLTPEQIKWDIEDQTFIRKEFIPDRTIEHKLEGNEDDEPLEIVQIGPKSTATVRHVDLSKIIDENWKEAALRKEAKNELWHASSGLLEGHGSLAKLAKEAHSKAEEIESEINKRSYERKQMKSRYGW